MIQGGLCSNHKKGEIFCCENHRTYDDVIIIKPEAALHWLKKWKPIDASSPLRRVWGRGQLKQNGAKAGVTMYEINPRM